MNDIVEDNLKTEKTKTFSLSSRHSLKFNNIHRLKELNIFVSEYHRVAELLLKELWRTYGFDERNFTNDIPKFIDTSVYTKYGITTWLSARVLQNIGKQVLAVIKGTIKKQKARAKMIEKLKQEGKFKRAKKLQRILDEQSISCPSLNGINPQLSNQCFKNLKFNNDICWVTICCIKSTEAKHNTLYDNCPEKIDLCFKLHKHFNALQQNGKLNNSILLTKTKIQFTFEFEEFVNESDKVIGVDIGVTNVFTCSNGQFDIADKDGWTYSKILDKLSKQKRGSKNFIQTSRHRKQYLCWIVKQLGIETAALLRRENIKDMYRGKNTCRKHKHFNYKLIFEILDSYCRKHGVRVETVEQRYTSQRCSHCGYVRKSNRNGKAYKCKNCGNTMDADLNAAINISLGLPKLTKKQRKRNLNRSGFFWANDKVYL